MLITAVALLITAVAFDCGYWMDHMQFRFPFTCDDFPQSDDPNVCVQLPLPVTKQGMSNLELLFKHC